MKKIYLVLILVLGVAVFNSSLMAVDYYSKSTGLFTTFSTWGTNTDGTGTSPSNFNSGTNIYHVVNRVTFNHTVNFNLNSSQTVVIGDGVTAINLTISAGGFITNAVVEVTNTATLTISKVAPCISTFGNLDPGSTVVYNANGVQVLPLNYGNITINQNAVLGSQIFVYGNLNIVSGQTLDLNGLNLNIDAKILGAGQIISSGTSGIYFTGAQTGNIGTLNLSGSSPQVNFIDITFGNPTAYFTLGNDVTIVNNGYFGQNSGGVDLNGHSLITDASSDMGFVGSDADGGIKGSPNSSIIINGTLNGNNALFMDQSSSTTRSLKTLVINSSAAFVTIGNDLQITDSLSVIDGNLDLNDFLTLKSTNALKARVSRVGGSISGNLKVETFAKGGSTGWTVLGPNGISGLSVSSWDGAGIPMSCVGCTYDPSTVYGFVSIEGYNEAGSGGTEYVELTSVSPLTEGKGYWVYLGDGFTSTNDLTWTTTGGIVTGSVNVGVTRSAGGATPGSNLVSNPYACPISWAKVLSASTGLNNAIYVYNPDLEITTQYVGGVASPGGTTGITDIIPAGQGFYIDATTNTTVHFTEAAKVANNTSANPLLKTTTDIGTVFRLKVNGFSGETDEAAIRFHSDATTSFDGKWDARKIFETPGYAGFPGPYSAYTTISTKSLNQDYSINSLPLVQSPNTVIPVLVKVKATGQYTISPLEIENLPANACVILKDKFLNINHDLRNSAYVCTISDTTSTARFELTVCYSDLTSTSVNTLPASDNSIIIGQNGEGAFVKTAFEKDTHAVISAYNVMGQKVIEDKEVTGTNNLVFLDLNNIHNQIIIIKVATDKKQMTKKVFVD